MKRSAISYIVAAVLVCALTAWLPSAALAQVGKLSGRVIQEESGESIPGANVILAQTQQGAAANAEGYYSIINIEPGVYAVRVSAVGFTTKTVEDVRVTADRTTTLNIELGEEVIEGQEIVVQAVRPVVDPNQTTTRSLVTGEEIEALPVASLQDVIDRTANSYRGYVRGSRRFETTTIVEGVDISDAFYSVPGGYVLDYGSATRAGKTENRLFALNPSAVQEVAINSGAKPARYSSASGGVVTVSLEEGRGPIGGSFSARFAPQINRPGPDSLAYYYDAEAYFAEREQLLELAAEGDEGAAQKAALYTWEPGKYGFAEDPALDVRASLGGEITDRWRFFTSAQWFQTNGFQPNVFRKRISGLLNTTYELSERTSISVVGIIEDKGLWGGWNNRDYGEVWRFYLEGLAQRDGGSYLGTVKLTQLIGDNAYLNAQYYRTFQRRRYGYVDDNGNGFTDLGEDGEFLDFRDPDIIERYIGTGDERGKMFYSRVSNDFARTGINALRRGSVYRLARPIPFSQDAIAVTNGFKVDFASQLTPNHFLEVGTELKLRRFDLDRVVGIDGLGVTLNKEDEPYVPHRYVRHPWEMALYASDRMEYGNLIVNLGLRVSLVDRDMERIVDHFYPLRRDTVMVAGRPLARNFFRRGEEVPMDLFFNPSIGVSHPIGETAAMYFSYAHSEQLPPYSRLYNNYGGNHSLNRFATLQDPEIDPITSNNYELGIQWEFVEGWGLDVVAYMRSIDNYGSVVFIANNRIPEGQPSLGLTEYRYRTDFGYADARGIELVVRRRPLELAEEVLLGLTASYTYSTVETARRAGANQNRFQADGVEGDQLPFENTEDYKHFAQDVRGGGTIVGRGYNRRHRGVLRLFAEFPFETSLGLVGSAESGLLYPRAIGRDPRDRELLTGPANYQIDLRLEKTFSFTERFALDFYIDVINLTNHQNVVAYDTFSPGGGALFQTEGIPTSRLILPDGTSTYGPARSFYFGTQLNF